MASLRTSSTRFGTMIVAMALVSAACAESSTAPVENHLIVRVVEDTIAAQSMGGGTWVSGGMTVELQNRSATDTVLVSNCGSIRLVDTGLEVTLDTYCPIPADPSVPWILPGETKVIAWEELNCPHAACGQAFDGDAGRYLVRVFYHLEPWFSAKSRMGDYMALSESFVVTLD